MGCGYPRSGTTWVCRLLSGYLNLPWAKRRMFPVIHNAVLHSHFAYRPGLSNCFYVYRDGRDIMVSQYYNRVRLMNLADHPGREKWRKIFTTLYGFKFDAGDIGSNLPRYVEFSLTDAHGARLTWPEHIQSWVQHERDNIAFLRYEDMLQDAFEPMRRGFEKFLDEPIAERRLRHAIEQASFTKSTGRQPGEEAPSDFFRKGVAGDWSNHFTREAAEIFAHHAGETLVDLGYEQDLEWVKTCQS